MTITEVLTLLLVIFAALTYIDNRHSQDHRLSRWLALPL